MGSTSVILELASFRLVNYFGVIIYISIEGMDYNLLEKPVSSPTAKELASWLKETDKATGAVEGSIAGRVFMVAGFLGEENEESADLDGI